MTLASEQAVRDTIERFYLAFSKKDVALLRQVVTPDWEYLPEPAGAAPGLEQMRKLFENMATALPDMNIQILDLPVHGNRSACVRGSRAPRAPICPASRRPRSRSISRFIRFTSCAMASSPERGI